MSSPYVVGSSQRGSIAALAFTSPGATPVGVITTSESCSPRSPDGDQNSVPDALDTSQNDWSAGASGRMVPPTGDSVTGRAPRARRTWLTSAWGTPAP